MLLSKFRELTADMDGEVELLCAGCEVCILWRNVDCVSIDYDTTPIEMEIATNVVLYRTPE